MEEYEGQIYIIQGVFVGSWAEMHSSRYLANDTYQILIQKMQESMPKSAFLAVRTPAYWRMAARTVEPLSESEAWDMSVLSPDCLCLMTGLWEIPWIAARMVI